VNRSLALAALAAFSALGLFGHSLHALLPCSDGSCGVHADAAKATCGCGHSHAVAAERVAAADSDETGARVSSAGHDAENCPLCTLLAKIKVDRPDYFHSQMDAAHCQRSIELGESLFQQDLALSGAPRGPPLA
jgi:hypothetical protein